jgi:hypothetical protein
MNRTRTAALLVAAPLLFSAGVSALGAAFDYPAILKRPAAEILAAFRTESGAVTFWFAVLALGAALMIPIAVGVGRLASNGWMRAAVPVGIAAGVLQVVGLIRWPLLVPGFAADATSADPAVAAAAVDSFQTAHRVMGNLIGETLGYLFTATWTLLVVAALGRSFAGRWFTALGATAAVLVLTGVLSPLDLPVVDTANLIGYVLWSIWLIAFAVVLWRSARRERSVSPRPVRVAAG